MRLRLIFSVLFVCTFICKAQVQPKSLPAPGYELRISKYVDSLRIIDTHEHLFDPDLLKGTYFVDFMLLFQQNGYDDLKSAGLPDSLFNKLFNEPLTAVQKWKLIEPYWKNS
ncbi:MAG: hypothetical protein IQL11_00075, partial [Bacteroidales bacterium]|nr:hypothetical protein [Bacteroidales bacterium]